MPAVLASDIRKRYQKKNNNKNKKKEKATDKKVASSSSTPKPAVRGVQSKAKSTTPSENKPALKPGKAKSATKKVGNAVGYALGIAPKNQRNARDIQQYQKARDEYVEQRDRNVRKSYELRRKNTGEYANKVNRAHVRGFSYDNNPDNQSYFLKQAAAGAWSIPEDIGKAVESLSSGAAKGEQAKLNPRGGKYSQTALDVRERARKNNQLNGDRYERFTDELNKDVRSGTLASQVAQGLGRMLPTMPLYAVGAGGALANLGKVNKATKAISTLAKPMSTAGAAVNTAAYYGERYDEAIKNGATPEQARKAALAYALPTAYLEGMGGAEKAFSKAIKPGFNPLKTAVKSGLSEGLEEVAQTPWEEYTKKAYGKNIPLFGRGSQEAVFNPDQLANAFTVGSILGAAGGGVAGIRTNTEINTYKNAVREDIKRQADDWEKGIKRALKYGAITNEEAAASRKSISDLVKRRTAEAMAEIDNRVKKSLNAGNTEQNDTEITANANTPNDEGFSYNAPNAAEETDNQFENGYEYGNAVEPNIPKPTQKNNPVRENKDIEMDEEEKRYGEQEFGIEPKEEPVINEPENDNVKLRGGTETLIDIYKTTNQPERVEQIKELISKKDPNLILGSSESNVDLLDIAAENLSDESINNVADAVQFVEDQIERNNGKGNKVTNAELAILLQEAEAARDILSLQKVWQLASSSGTEQGRDLASRRLLRLLTPAGRALVNESDMQKKAAASVGFDTAEITQKMEGGKTNGLSNLQTAINDFIDSDVESDISEISDNTGVIANKIRRRKLGKIIDKSGKAYDSKRLRKKIEEDRAKQERINRLKELGVEESDLINEERDTDKKPKFKKPGSSILNDRYEKELRKALKLNPETEKLIVKYPKIKDIIRDVMRENPPDIKEALMRNDINTASFVLAKHVTDRVRLDTDILIDQRREEKQNRGEQYGELNVSEDLDSLIFDYVYKNIAERTRKLREREIKKLLTETGRSTKAEKKKYNIVQELMYYNNLGLLDNPKTANEVYKALTVPYLTEQEIATMIERHDLADRVRNNEVDEITSNELNALTDKETGILNRALEKNDREYAADALVQLAQKIPEDKLVGNVWQKLRQQQITGMLGNLKTVARNVVPNIAMMPLNQAGRVGGAIVDKGLSKTTGVRTYGAPTGLRETARNMKTGYNRAVNDLILGIDTSSQNKTELQMRHAFNNENLAGKVLNKATDLTSFGLKLGDLPFENAYYQQSLKRQMELNNVNEPTALMEEIAQLEAMQQTFKDENKFTQITQEFVDTLNKIGGGKGAYGIGSIIVPFVRTPANLTKLMVDYAPPAALVETGVAFYKFKNAVEPDEKLRYQHQFANTFSHLVSGTLLSAFMWVLKSLDLIEITGGSDEDDWRESQYESQVHGKQDYSIRIGNRWYNYENLQPIGSLMALAVDSYDYIFNGEEQDKPFTERLLGGIVNGILGAGNMLYESSVYKGIGDLFSGKEKIPEVVAGVIASIPQQFNPALVQQFSRTVDPWQRDTTSAVENPVGRIFAESGNKLLGSVPFLSYLLPQKTDAYGLPMQRYDSDSNKFVNKYWDAANAFLMPFTITQDKAGNFSGLDQKTADAYAESIEYIEKLNSTFPDKNLLPQTAGRTIKINGEYVRLTGDERQQWQKDSGGKLLKDVTALLKTNDFNSLSEGQQATVIGNTLAAYKEQAKHAIANSKKLIHNIDSKFSKPLGAEDIGQSVGEYYTQIKQIGNSVMPEDQRPDGEEYYTASDYKRYYLIEKYENGELTEDQVIYYMKAADVLSDKWEDEMSAADKQGISKINFIMAKEEMTILSNDRNLDKRQKEIEAAKIADKYGDDIDQKQWLLTTLSNMGMYMPDNDIKKMVFDGDESDIIFDAVGVHAREMWEGNDKYCPGIAGKNEFDSAEQFYNALSMVDAEGRKKVDVVAAIDQINGTARQKACMLAAKGYSNKGVTFHDGGSIDIPESSGIKRPTLNTGSSSSKSTTKTSTATPSKPATTSTATKTAGTIASQIRQLQNASKGFSSAYSRVAQRTGEKMKSTIESIMPTKPTTYEGARRSSGFGLRESPGGIGSTNHKGVDIAVDGLTDVGAVAFVPGTIAYVGKRGGYGNVVEYMANDGNYIILGHLDSIAKGLKAGDKVSSGKQVGIVGSTGTSTGTHLHVEVRPGGRDGTPVDPETVYDLFGDGIKTPSADSNYQASSAYSSSSSSSSSSSDSSSGSSGSGRSGGGSSKKKRKPISTGSSYGSYSYGGYTPSSSYSSGYTPGSYTPGSYNP